MGWELFGEDAEALVHDGRLPLDWRTKTKAMQAYAGEIDRSAAIDGWHSATMRHGYNCWAPPGEWYGGTWVDWPIDPEDDQDGPPGWWNVGEHTWCPVDADDDSECADRADILCLGLDKWDDDAVRAACESAPLEVHLVTAGEGWPWLSRIIGPVTVVFV